MTPEERMQWQLKDRFVSALAKHGVWASTSETIAQLIGKVDLIGTDDPQRLSWIPLSVNIEKSYPTVNVASATNTAGQQLQNFAGTVFRLNATSGIVATDFDEEGNASSLVNAAIAAGIDPIHIKRIRSRGLPFIRTVRATFSWGTAQASSQLNAGNGANRGLFLYTNNLPGFSEPDRRYTIHTEFGTANIMPELTDAGVNAWNPSNNEIDFNFRSNTGRFFGGMNPTNALCGLVAHIEVGI